jgi:hypothetical protein
MCDTCVLTVATEMNKAEAIAGFDSPLTGELQGSHDPSGIVFTVLAALSGMERDIRDRTLEGHESAPGLRRSRMAPGARSGSTKL